MPDSDSHHDQEYDAVIVGTGMGGATLGYALARAGWSVLFLEKGRSHLNQADGLRGEYAEAFFHTAEKAQGKHRETLLRAGRWHEKIEDQSRTRTHGFIPVIGCGTGGSSALYGMAMERLRACDFTQWPIGLDDLDPYYAMAERWFGAGIGPELHPANAALWAHFRAQGLHPYRLQLACEFSAGSDRCQGFLAANAARRDAGSVCLEPALRRHGARLIDQCTVSRIDATRSRVTGLVCSARGKQFTVRGKTVVLAAGALATPCLLLNSMSRSWLRGLANGSGLVGRNLMRHFIDLCLVPTEEDVGSGNLKQIAFADWYENDGKTQGVVQSFGNLPPTDLMVSEMMSDVRKSRWSALAPALSLARPLLQRAVERKVDRCVALASIMEDRAQESNFVRPGKQGEAAMRINYRIHPDDAVRIERFRGLMRDLFAPLGASLIKQAENNERLAHVSGTCRMGVDPSSSVVDSDCRAHEVDNLYVVDASIFPSSGGTNPALTIAANALRVAERMIAQGSRAQASLAGMLTA